MASNVSFVAYHVHRFGSLACSAKDTLGLPRAEVQIKCKKTSAGLEVAVSMVRNIRP